MKKKSVSEGRSLANLLAMRQARTIMGPRRFFGPNQVKKALGITIKPQDIPPLGFSVAELVRAKELGQFLILRVDKAADGLPLTAEKIVGTKDNRLSNNGRLLFSATGLNSWFRYDGFYLRKTPKLSWALVSIEVVKGTTRRNYLWQTVRLAEHIRSEIFRNMKMPKEYEEALEEFQKERADIEQLMIYNLRKAASKLDQLKINQLFRRSFADLIYDLVVVKDGRTGGKALLECSYDWLKDLDFDDDKFVNAGRFDADGAYVLRNGPDHSLSRLGVCLSRNPSDAFLNTCILDS